MLIYVFKMQVNGVKRMINDINWFLIGILIFANIVIQYFVIKWAVYSALVAHDKDKDKDKDKGNEKEKGIEDL